MDLENVTAEAWVELCSGGHVTDRSAEVSIDDSFPTDNTAQFKNN